MAVAVSRKSKVYTISLPPELALRAEALAKRDSRTTSELFREDDMFLECAALARADLLVAGDKDLLSLGTYIGTRIVTPAGYLRGE